MKYEYEGTFLEQWPQLRRSLIVNQFCYAVRAGAKTVDTVLNRVAFDAQKRFAAEGDATPQGASQRILLAAIDTAEARRFAGFVLWRESLPYEVKQRLKAETGMDHKLAHMKRKPPSRAQLAYLESLACHVVPQNMLEASQLIDKYRNGDLSRS